MIRTGDLIGIDLEEGVGLVRISIGLPIDFEPRNAGDIHCIDLDLQETTFDGALAWIRAVQDWRMEKGRLPLCIVVMCCEERLSIEDLWRVSEELEPASAIFHSWPEECASFEETFRSFGRSYLSRESLTVSTR